VTAELRIMGIGLLGANFSSASFRRGLEQSPHVIASDGGTSDKGPYFLGTGVVDTQGIRRDLNVLMPGSLSVKAPLLFGSVGTAGGDAQVDAVTQIAIEVARRQGLHLRIASIKSELDPKYVAGLVAAGRVQSFGSVGPLTEDDVTSSDHIVGMMGVEPFQEALDAGADLIIGGRAVDPAMFAAPLLNAGRDPGLAWHTGMAMDKGPMITQPTSAGSCILGRVAAGSAVISPTHDRAVCTPRSVAATMVYESADPYQTVFPSGTLDLTQSTYEAVDDRSVRVSGGQFLTSARYTVKIEGARFVGYRAVAVMGIRDPFLIADLGEFFENTRTIAARNLERMGIGPQDYTVRFRVYGRDGVMGTMEPSRAHVPQEVGVLVEAVATTAELAVFTAERFTSIAHRVEFKGRLTTAGNVSSPFSGPPLSGGPVFEWSAWHIIEPDQWTDARRVEYTDV
jgi:Acyclic terpene utilisation family protein AtuA